MHTSSRDWVHATLSALIVICIIAGAIALGCGLMFIQMTWGTLATMPLWRPTIAACLSAGAFALAWGLRVLRERIASND
jgi:hypothetical protein